MIRSVLVWLYRLFDPKVPLANMIGHAVGGFALTLPAVWYGEPVVGATLGGGYYSLREVESVLSNLIHGKPVDVLDTSRDFISAWVGVALAVVVGVAFGRV